MEGMPNGTQFVGNFVPDKIYQCSGKKNYFFLKYLSRTA
jgi:hypothetical protein